MPVPPESLAHGPFEDVAHVIQVALTPVFLLSAIAALLNVFSTRLARVSDRVDQLARRLDGASPSEAARLSAQLASLHRRSFSLEAAVILGAVAGTCTCVAALTLFVGALRDTTVAGVLFTSFGLAILCAIGALGGFLTEMLLAGRGIRAMVARHRSEAEADAEAGESGSHGAADGSGAETSPGGASE